MCRVYYINTTRCGCIRKILRTDCILTASGQASSRRGDPRTAVNIDPSDGEPATFPGPRLHPCIRFDVPVPHACEACLANSRGISEARTAMVRDSRRAIELTTAVLQDAEEAMIEWMWQRDSLRQLRLERRAQMLADEWSSPAQPVAPIAPIAPPERSTAAASEEDEGETTQALAMASPEDTAATVHRDAGPGMGTDLLPSARDANAVAPRIKHWCGCGDEDCWFQPDKYSPAPAPATQYEMPR